MSDNRYGQEHNVINGVATDLLIHIDEFVDSKESYEHYSRHLSERSNISIDEAKSKIKNALADTSFLD